MLRAIPKSLFSWDFDILENDENVALLDLATIREAGEIFIDGDEGKIYREGFASGAYILEIEEGALALAEKKSAFTRVFKIKSLEREFVLKPVSVFSQNFLLFEDGLEVGSIVRDFWLTRKCTVDLPSDLPLLVQLFFLYLVVIVWRRQASSSG